MHIIESSPNAADGYVPNNSNLFGSWIDSPTAQVDIFVHSPVNKVKIILIH